MRILIYGINYDPELTGIGVYTGQMARWLAKCDHQVTVITGMPYYPEWKLNQAYKGKLWQSEELDGVRLYRAPLYIPAQVTSAKRIIHEFSFLLSVLPIFILTLFQKKYDIVMCVSPPFHLGIFPYLYSKIRGTHFVTHIQDLQIDAAKQLGMIKNQALLKSMFMLENFLLKSSRQVSTISLGMKKKILTKGIAEENLRIYHNSVNTNQIVPVGKERSMLRDLNFDLSDKIVLYSGNLGEKQGLEYLIEAAVDYISRPEIKFVIVGSGAYQKKLISLTKEKGCHNVHFFPLQPYESLSELMGIADLHLVLQKGSAADLLMPSKLSTILAAGGCPIVSALPGSFLYDIVDQHKLGILIKPECAVTLSNAIGAALQSDLAEYRENARRFAEDYLKAETTLSGLENDFKRIAEPNYAKLPALVEVERLEKEAY